MAGRIIFEEVTELSKCEIFVFGTNLAGKHYRGAARTAYKNFGAEWGVGSGRTGQAYAIPTMRGKVDEIKPYADEFIEYAKNHPNNRFLLTRIGCDPSGYKDSKIAPLFSEAWKLPNVNFSKRWYQIITADVFWDALIFGNLPKKEIVPLPDAITENDLIRFSKQYRYVIGSGVKAPLPKIRVRYVIDKDRFGYTYFGNFIMTARGEMYVWSGNKEFANEHNQDIVEYVFEDECRGRGYLHKVIFAGVETPYKDSNGENIFTGDVIDINNGEMKLALSTLGENTDNADDLKARYAFVLDNHFLRIADCRKATRIGTVFFRLDWNDNLSLRQRCDIFQGCYPGGLSDEDKLVMTKYTPNFDKEIWKYHALEKIGAEEFKWRK